MQYCLPSPNHRPFDHMLFKNLSKKIGIIQLEHSKLFYSLVCVIYFVISYNSKGFNNADEHFQIIEFAQYKLGNSTASDLAWEFNSRIRPSLQPTLCFLVFKILGMLGITDSYILAFSLRLLTGIASLAAIRYFTRSYRGLVKEENVNVFLVMSYFLWFLPYINVRFSSETWSGIMFLFFLSLIIRGGYKTNWQKSALLGLIFGLSVLFRFQSGILVVGAVLWLIFIARIGRGKLLIVLAFSFFTLLLGVLLDWWFYGEFCLTLYSYFYENIINGVASQYGVSPWYQIPLYIIKSPGPIGLIIFFSILFLIYKDPKNLIVWTVIPFLIIHSIIPHKELRFLFPLAGLSPLIMILAYQSMGTTSMSHAMLRSLLVFAAAINVLGLWAIGTRSAGNAKIGAASYIDRRNSDHPVHLLFVKGLNPYSDWPFPKNTFYSSRRISMQEISTIWKPELLKRKKGFTNLLLVSSNEITGPKTLMMLKGMKAVPVFDNFDSLTQMINKVYDPDLNEDLLKIYELR
ncbi:hypothetical protein ACFOG5_06005 [Pedobacter fastidiosus]|uniref:hypothetical protein n=1 Tax=Pedobacter fastidiosus TaxID=2765361 RepID=UPI00361F304A